MKIEKVTVKNFMSLSDLKTGTMIRFLDQSENGLPNIYWKPLPKVYTIKVPLDQAEDLMDISAPVPTSILRNDWRVKLKPHVREWCIESLEMNRAYARRHAEFDFSKDAENVVFTVEFECERDALHFKLRWIG